MDTLVEKLANCINYFWRLSGFPDLSGKVFFLSNLNFPLVYVYGLQGYPNKNKSFKVLY